MSETELIEALDRTVTATWEQERSTSQLQSLVGRLATRARIDELDTEFTERIAA